MGLAKQCGWLRVLISRGEKGAIQFKIHRNYNKEKKGGKIQGGKIQGTMSHYLPMTNHIYN